MLVIFDDIHRIDFSPLTQLRVTGDLRCGILKLRQRLELLFSEEDDTAYIVPKDLQDLYRERHPDWDFAPKGSGQHLYLNARLIVTPESIRSIRSMQDETVLLSGDSIVAIRSAIAITDPTEPGASLKSLKSIRDDKLTLYAHPAQLIHDNDRMIRFDFEQVFADKDNYFETEPGVTVLHPYNVWLGEDVILKPGVVLDASDGPIVIDDNALVMANSVIIGPCYIGKKTIIKIGAKIYQSCSIGPVCKIGGELEGTIIQAYSNKQHDGFLGHSYIGEWVNLGADTNNSDLKNTYKNVYIYSYSQKAGYDTGTRFMGCLIGDHAKLGINSTINTGAVLGTGVNLWGRELISGFIQDFSWGQADSLSPYRLEAFIETARLVKDRRNLSLSKAEERLFDKIQQDNLEI